MEKRKNPEKDLRSKSGLFFQIGLLITMMLCVSAFEYRTHEMIMDPIDLIDPVVDVPFKIVTVQPPPPKPIISRPVEVNNNEELEDIIQNDFIPIDEIGDIEIPEFIDAPSTEIIDAPFLIVEEMPTPKGGYAAFFKFVQKNLKYPSQARRMNIQGKVFVNFIVNEDGELVDFQIMKGIGAGCDEEVLRIMRKAPKWNPGKQRGKAVRVKQVLPITFQLN
jgi:periplasmic protein TonB